jgi:NADPH:quinone reductase-like Zn-dependent oxidoreductase
LKDVIAADSDVLVVPTRMKAAISRGFGSIDDNICVVNNWPSPCLPQRCKSWGSRHRSAGGNDGDAANLLLVRVLACALAPGDARLLKGSCDYAQLPFPGHPYVVGSDASGIVVDALSSSAKFQRGDYVVSRFDGIHPVGGCAELRLAEERFTEKCPVGIPPVVAASLPASAMAAKRIAREFVRRGDRVLIVGGSGGVGTSLIQYARWRATRGEASGGTEEKQEEGAGASLGSSSSATASACGMVAAVSTQRDVCLSLGADRVIDYRSDNWWEDPDFLRQPLDVVIDLVNGPDNWPRGGRSGPGTAIRRGGTYVAVLTGVASEIEVHSPWDMVKTAGWVIGRTLWTRLNPHRLARWTVPDGLRLEEGDLAGLLEDVAEGRLRPVLDPSSPFEFSTQGVRDAMRLQQSAHAHGKVVIKIADIA